MMTLKERSPRRGFLRRIQDTSARIGSQYVEMPSRILLDASSAAPCCPGEAKVTLTDHAGHRVELPALSLTLQRARQRILR